MTFNEIEKRAFIRSLVASSVLILIMWQVKLLEIALDIDFAFLGIYPRTLHGIAGIFTSPFVHGDIDHLLSNSFPLFVLIIGLFYFFRKNAGEILLVLTIVTQGWVWLVARPAYHIGASGVVYALFGFILLSGFIRRSREALALSAVVLFLYGGMLIGISPMPSKPDMSWESHLMGLLAGFFAAFFYRRAQISGLIKEEYDFQKEQDDPGAVSFTDKSKHIEFVYYLKEDKENEVTN